MLKVSYELNEYGVSGQAENIGENQAVTVFTNLPRGYFKNAFKLSAAFPETMFALTAILSVLYLILSLIFRSRAKFGRVVYYPPEEMDSAKAGGNLSRRRAFYGPAFSDPLLGPAGLCGDSWPEEEKDGGDPSREKERTSGIRSGLSEDDV